MTHDIPPATSEMKSVGGVTRIGRALRYSLQGLGHAVRHEAAFRQELLIVVPAALAAWLLPVSQLESIVLFASLVMVLIVELLNSAIEAVVDRVSTERHPLSGRAKDMGSAAVLLAVCVAALCWLLIAGPLVLRWMA